MILQNDVPWLILGNKLYPFRPQGYASPTTRPDDPVLVTVLTPAPTVAVLAAGYRPHLHPSAP